MTESNRDRTSIACRRYDPRRAPRRSAGRHRPTPRLGLSVLNVSHERFRIIQTYAQGGLGVVSLAHDVELDRVVAVKEMRYGRPSKMTSSASCWKPE